MSNERYKQTYYGAIDLQSHELLIQPYKKGESSSTIAFLKYLQSQYPESRIALIWDGAQRVRADRRKTTGTHSRPHHRSGEVKSYLYCRDVTLGEDKSRIRTEPLPQLWSIARNLALNLYRDAGFNNMAQAKRKSQFGLKHILFLFRMK